ncbi:L10-interacting MYB domain-containing protein-like protein [Tanacetum coccineum]
MAVNLSPGAISILLSGNYETVMKPVVQVLDIKCMNTQTEIKGNRVEKIELYDKIIVSDGSVCEDVYINYKIDEMIRSEQLQKGSIVQLTQFSSNTTSRGSRKVLLSLLFSFHLTPPLAAQGKFTLKVSNLSFISVHDLNVIRCNCIILGDPKPFPGNQTPSVNKFIPPKLEEDHVDPDVNDDRPHADEPTAPKQKCSSCSQTQSRKRERQSSDNKEDGEIGACFEKLEKLGWEEGPMYDTAVLLFGESSDYRKIWLHLKPKSCVNWVKNAGERKYSSFVTQWKSLKTISLSQLIGLWRNDSSLSMFRDFNPNKETLVALKPESCGKWVKNAGIKFGLLG